MQWREGRPVAWGLEEVRPVCKPGGGRCSVQLRAVVVAGKPEGMSPAGEQMTFGKH